MAAPRSTRITRDGVTYLNNVEHVKWTIWQLTCFALRDTGIFICKRFKKKYYQHFKKKTGRVSSYCQYWVRKNKKYQDIPDLVIGIKPGGFYGGFQELGTEYQPKLGLLKETVSENLDEINNIQAQYLTGLNEENLMIVDEEGDYIG